MVEAADEDGSTEYIIRRCEELPAGASAVIGTDWNLVNRLRLRHPDKRISCLKEDLCPCVTMNRIDLPKLTWCLESLAAGEIVNVVAVDPGDGAARAPRARPDARPGVTAAEVVAAALAEDLGERGDITSELLVPADAVADRPGRRAQAGGAGGPRGGRGGPAADRGLGRLAPGRRRPPGAGIGGVPRSAGRRGRC